MTVLHSNFIGGQAVTLDAGDRIKVYNPARDTVLSEIPDTPAEMVDRAVEAAKKAQKSWARLPAIQRANALRRISAKIRENVDKIAHVISEEQGKILSLAKVEVDFSADYLDYMAEFARRYEGEIIQSDRPGENILFYKSADRRRRRHPPLELPLLPHRAQDRPPRSSSATRSSSSPAVRRLTTPALFACSLKGLDIPKGVIQSRLRLRLGTSAKPLQPPEGRAWSAHR